MRVLILGAGGFIGASLTREILKSKPDWRVIGLDVSAEKLKDVLEHPQLTFEQASLEDRALWVQKQIQAADVVLPLIAIADPALYVTDPLKVFTLDFEANLQVVRWCSVSKTHVIFPSTSEVYGLCQDAAFNEQTSCLTQGPIHKQRWIYSSAKQLLDRVIYAMGVQEGLNYTIFRPFNWVGPYLDHLDLRAGGRGRVLVRLLGDALRGRDIRITGDGLQRRAFTDIRDSVRALLGIIENLEACTHKIFNIGAPKNDVSLREFAGTLLNVLHAHPLCPAVSKHVSIRYVEGVQHFGEGYQDIARRVPCIAAIQEALGWQPVYDLRASLEYVVDYHLRRLYAEDNPSLQSRAG